MKPSKAILATVFVTGLILAWMARPHRFIATVRVGAFESRQENPTLIKAISDGRMSEVVRLLDKGASPDSVVGAHESEGETALEAAAGTGNADLVRLLLDRGADINAPDLWGGTAIVTASIMGFPEVVKLLIDRGADVNADDDGATALGYAEHQLQEEKDPKNRARYEQVVGLLRKAGARRSPFWL